MEDVLEVYTRSYDEKRPQICFDEGSTQFTKEKISALEMEPGKVRKEDYQYTRAGYCNFFMACEPLTGKRVVQVEKRRTKVEFAHFMRRLVDKEYIEAEKLVLVMDNLNTHTLGALYEVFPAEEAMRLCQKLEIHHTPKHGSWLNMAEIELSVLGRQVLREHLGTMETVKQRVADWQAKRNQQEAKISWRFTAADARIKLRRLYPSIEVCKSLHNRSIEG